MTEHSFWFYGFAFVGLILIRYFLIAGGVYFLFYSLLPQFFNLRRLHQSSPPAQSIYRDIKLSVSSTVVFALGAAFILKEYEMGFTLLYSNLHQYGLWYLAFSFVAVLILQDTYFYFIHRLFHRPFLFKWIHRGHHRSGDSTPWTSFAFDLPEAFLQALFFAGIVFVIPLHFMTLLAVLMTMTLWAVWNHLGFELFPPSFPQHWLGRWLIGSTHHSLHHRKYTVHYGLYFTFWDKCLGTDDPHYEKEFDLALRR